MKKLLSLTILLCAINSSHAQVVQNHNVSPDDIKIRELVNQYTESINNADSILGYTLFAHIGKVSFIHSRGDEHSWEEIKHNIYKFLGDTYSKRKLKIDSESVWLLECAAWVEIYYTFDATLKKDNSNIQVKYRETQLWIKNDEWRLAVVHDSDMPNNK
jgi:hypothetical protein